MKTHKLNYKDMEVYYYEEGNPEKETILMLHPAFADYTMFEHQLRDLHEDYHMIAIDMVTHGKSQRGNSSANMGDMPEIVKMIMEKEAIKEAHLLGVSLGSLIGQAVADYIPDRIKSVTVVGGYSIHKANKEVKKAQAKEMGKWLGYMIFSMPKFRRYITEVSSHTEYSRAVMERCTKQFKRRHLMGMQGMNNFMVDDPRPVVYPLLVVCGEYDLELAKEMGKNWAELEPSGSYIEIANAGHCANMDQSEQFNKIYKGFLCKL